jgi:RNA polymerase sigma-70 factor (ECF subfamily)
MAPANASHDCLEEVGCGPEEQNVADFDTEALPHMDGLFRVAAATLRSRAEAEDAVQETYLQAFKSFHRFTPGTNCRAWLFRILFHVISHQRRKWFGRIVFSEREDMERNAIYVEPVPEELTDAELIEAVRALPLQYAEVLLLADVQEFSYKEVQETLRIPIGTVMSRLSRGRQMLRSKLGNRRAPAGTASAAACVARPNSGRTTCERRPGRYPAAIASNSELL